MKVGLKNGIVECVFTVGVSILLGVGLVGCGTLSRSARSMSGVVKAKKKDLATLTSDQHAIDQKPERGLAALSNSKVVAKVGELTREEDIVWAPEDPDMPIAELEGIEVNDENPMDSWYEDFGKAMNKARLTGRPVMIWFTRSKNSPLCQLIGSELFVKRGFLDWADENIIKLRIDSFITGGDSAERQARERYVAGLKKRYRVMGNPVVVVVSPRGTEFGKYRGYKSGSAEFYFGRLKNAHRSAEQDYSSWLSEMEGKGYRAWSNLRGKSIFAKVVRYRSGKIWLVEPDGKKSSTLVKKLSVEDRQYIERKVAESRAKRSRD